MITFQGFALFLFVGLRAGKLIKKSATKPIDSLHYSSVALFLASGNFITFGNGPLPARPTKRNSAKPMLLACCGPQRYVTLFREPRKTNAREARSKPFKKSKRLSVKQNLPSPLTTPAYALLEPGLSIGFCFAGNS